MRTKRSAVQANSYTLSQERTFRRSALAMCDQTVEWDKTLWDFMRFNYINVVTYS